MTALTFHELVDRYGIAEDDGTLNAERALWAAAAVDAFTQLDGQETPEQAGWAQVLGDLIGDLLHLAVEVGEDPEVIAAAGMAHFVAEAGANTYSPRCRHCDRPITFGDDGWVDGPVISGVAQLVFCTDQDETHDGIRHEPRDPAHSEQSDWRASVHAFIDVQRDRLDGVMLEYFAPPIAEPGK